MQPKLHFRRLSTRIAAVLLICGSPLPLMGARVDGVTATTTMGSDGITNLQNTVNAAGLSSQSLTATHAATTPDNSWISAAGVLTGSVTFDLHASLVVTGFSFWNQNGGGPFPGTGIRSVTITYSTDGVTYRALPGAPTQFDQVGGTNVPPQIIAFPGVLATHIRFQILSNYGDPDETGFAEVGFNGAPNQPPTISAPDTITMDEDVASDFTVITADPDGDPNEPPMAMFSKPEKGTITGTRTNFRYTPNPNANGTDSFTITAQDNHGGVTTKTVNLTIASINDVPVFAKVPSNLSTGEDTALRFDVIVSDADGDSVTLTIPDGQKGTVTRAGDTFTYTPGLNANGSDSLVATITDGHGATASATVNIRIVAGNDAPVFTFIPSSLRTNEDAETNFTITTSDTENDPVTLVFTDSSKGTIFGTGPSYTYRPNPGVTGDDRFTVTASDGRGGVTVRGVTVQIIGAPTIAGRYALLLADDTGVHASLALILNRRGSVSGFLRDDTGQSERFYRTVKLPPGERSATVRLANGSSLSIEFDSNGHVAATLTSPTRVLGGNGNVGVPPAANVPGRYTMVLDTGTGGFGWCVMTVTPRGSVRVSGRLPDGSIISASPGMPIDGESNAPLFLLGNRREIPVLSGSLHFAPDVESDVTGALTFRAGALSGPCDASGAQFLPANSALPAGSYPLGLTGEGVSINSNLTLNSDNTATVENPLISFIPRGGVGRPANGLFSIRLREAAAAEPALSGTGVFIQKGAKGFGQFLKNGATGQVLIGTPP